MGIRDRLERLKYTRIKGGSEVAAGARTVGKKFSKFREGVGQAVEEARVRRQQRPLEKYQREQHRRDLAETRVYGRTLTEKERGQFQRVQKEKQEQRQRRLATLSGQPQRTYRQPRRGRRAKVVYVQKPKPLMSDLGGAGELLGLGPSRSAPAFMGNGRRKRKDSLNLGGLLY